MFKRDALPTKRPFLLALSIILLCLRVSGRAQHAPEVQERRVNSQAPLQAELLISLDAGKLSRGSLVLAKARLGWKGPTCQLRAGSVVSGHIIDLEQRSKQNKGSSLTILFDHADCDGHTTPISFTLFAVIATSKEDEGHPLVDNEGLFGGKSSRPVMGVGGGMNSAPQRLDVKNDMTMRAGASDPKTPSYIALGQVIGLNKVTLSVGTGPEGSSVLTAAKGNIRLESATQLILMPEVAVVPDATPTLTAKAEEPIPPAPPTPVEASPKLEPTPPPSPPETDETEICTAPCNVVSSAAGPELPRASATLSAARFGYLPHDRREYYAFDYESTLIYLDSENLLFTFDPHTLRQRYASGPRTESMRTVRAILLNPKTLAVKRVREWQVQDEGQYIWRAGPGQILVHLGHQLRLLGPDLNVVRVVAVPGQLAFVSVSPSGDRIAAGVLHERHNREIHTLLVTALHVEPEEDVDIQVFDHKFNVLLTALQSSSLPPPILSDAGEIRVTSTGNNHWRISEYLWDHTERTVATTISGCRLKVTAPLPESLFLVGCVPSQEKNWYRMLRLDGHPILQGKGSSQEIEQSSSSSNQSEFVVRVVRAEYSRPHGGSFHKEDLRDQEFSIYRATDGKRLFLTRTPGVSLVEQSFALSPNGHQLAVLTNATLSFYSIGTSVQ